MSAKPLVYLGYPLTTSVQQRDAFCAELLSKIQTACSLHSHRSLSFRGRALIANSLILSRLWHVLRVISLPAALFTKVRSLISQFMNRQVFPKLSFAVMCRPRRQGGLGLLDPRVQQHTLQLRRLTPLLLPSPNLDNFILLPRLIDWLIHGTSFSSSVSTEHWSHLDCRLAFIFPSLRHPSLTGFNSVFSLLFMTLDALPRSFESIVVSPVTCLQLPLSAVIIPPQDLVISPTLLRLPCSLLYFLDFASQRLQPKSSPQLATHPTLCKQFLSQVRSNLIKLQSFFVKACIPPAYAAIGSRPSSLSLPLCLRQLTHLSKL